MKRAINNSQATSLPYRPKVPNPLDSINSDAPVTHILAHKIVEDGFTHATCWAIFLQISETESFRLHLRTGPITDCYRKPLAIFPGCFVPTPKASLVFPILRPNTIRMIANLINNKRHAIYGILERVQADKVWLYTMVEDMEDGGIVEQGASKKVWDTIENDKINLESEVERAKQLSLARSKLG